MKRFIGLFLSLFILLTMNLTVFASDKTVVDHESIGSNCSWTFYSDGTLTIHGTDGLTDRNWSTANWFRQYASQIKFVCIEDGCTGIGSDVFKDFSNLIKIRIPESVGYIGSSAFENCPKLTRVIVYGNTLISSSAFDSTCNVIFLGTEKEYIDLSSRSDSTFRWQNQIDVFADKIEIDGDQYWIADDLFVAYKGNNEYIEISENLLNKNITEIADYAFKETTSLKELILSNSVTTTGESILENCSNIVSISVPYIGGSRVSNGSSNGLFGYLFGCSSSGEYVEAKQYYSSINYETYNIPTSLKNVYITDANQIPYGAFSGCSGLEYIELNEGITQIGQKAFADCGFLSVHIPKSVTRIGSDAFSGTDVEKLYVSINSYGHQYAVANGYPYEFYDYHPVTGITLSEVEIDVVEGNTCALTATVVPDNATYNGVIWKSSDKSVVTVNENGLVTAVSKGTATITATTEENNFTSSCVVNVLRPVTDIELNYSELNIGVGYTKTLTATVYPETASNKSVVWSTDDDSVATVSNGIVTAVGYGTTKIKATTVDGGYVAECTVNSTIPVNGISLNKSNMEMIAGDTVSLVATVNPTDAFDKSISWSSSNTTVATVENGLVTAKSEGTVTITAKTNDGGKTASCVITVNAPVVNVTDITLNKCDISLNVGESETLVATITPSTATNKNIMWTSSNESIATVDENGKVTAKTNGIAIITATTADGNKEVTCTVTVTGESDNKIVIGDVNGDGEVDFADAIVVLKYDAGITTLTGDKLTAADTNGDGEVDFVDAIQILKYDGGLISSFN